MTDELTPPTSGFGDLAHSTLKGLLGEFPGGSTAAEVLAFFFGSPIETRRQKFYEAVVHALKELQQRGVDVVSICKDPVFVDTVVNAVRVAMSTSQQEKLDALRNAILNSGLPRAPEPDLRQMFLGMIDRFTGWHLRLLSMFDDPIGHFRSMRKDLPRHISPFALLDFAAIAFPELESRQDFAEQICADLQQAGLLFRADSSITRIMLEAESPRTTNLGKQFVQFVRMPE